MNKKWQFFASLGQVIIGTLAIAAFVIIAINGVPMTKWIIALLLASVFLILGIKGIVKCKSNH